MSIQANKAKTVVLGEKLDTPASWGEAEKIAKCLDSHPHERFSGFVRHTADSARAAALGKEKDHSGEWTGEDGSFDHAGARAFESHQATDSVGLLRRARAHGDHPMRPRLKATCAKRTR